MPVSVIQSTNTGSATAGYTLQNVGDTITVQLGVTGVGQPPDVTAIISLAGTYTAATVAVEAVALGQPIVTGSPTAPLYTYSWVPVTEIGVQDGQTVSSPIGPLTSVGTAGSGYAYQFGCGVFSMLRLRLVSIGSGAILGGIATIPFPIQSGLVNNLNAGMLLELQRIRVGINMLLASTDMNDNLASTVPTFLGTGN